mmetsp:Transcript_88300/g.205440  ORF Transcript_88300/g.205440 Transcript_88300/m.205440 type:complete len:227 (-) Transcript_88300:684-1364(-)
MAKIAIHIHLRRWACSLRFVSTNQTPLMPMITSMNSESWHAFWQQLRRFFLGEGAHSSAATLCSAARSRAALRTPTQLSPAVARGHTATHKAKYSIAYIVHVCVGKPSAICAPTASTPLRTWQAYRSKLYLYGTPWRPKDASNAGGTSSRTIPSKASSALSAYSSSCSPTFTFTSPKSRMKVMMFPCTIALSFSSKHLALRTLKVATASLISARSLAQTSKTTMRP